MKLTSLQAFVAVLECGSIHAGARKLGISQPALSKTLRALEEELGVQLVTRTSRGTVATEHGRTFLDRAQLVVREVERARQEVEQLKGNLLGSLAVSISPATTLKIFPQAVQSFRRECPDIELHVSESLQPQATDLVRSNLVELALAPLTAPLSPHEFKTEALAQVEMVAVVRKSHKLAGETRLANLHDADWLQLGPGGSPATVTERAFTDIGIMSAPTIAVTCQSLNSAVALMLTCDLVSMLPLPFVQLPQMADLFTILDLDSGPVTNEIGMIYRADSPLTPAAQLLAGHLRLAAGQTVQ